MDSPLLLYTSDSTDQGLHGFVEVLAMNLGRKARILPLTALPRPDTQRRQALRLERGELLESIQRAEFGLEQYCSGAWQPDAGHESGLRFDLEALKNRLRAVETVLGVEKGGADNA